MGVVVDAVELVGAVIAWKPVPDAARDDTAAESGGVYLDAKHRSASMRADTRPVRAALTRRSRGPTSTVR